MMKKVDSTVLLFGLTFFGKGKGQLLKDLCSHLESEENLLTIVTPNPEQIILSRDNSQFFKYLSIADIKLPDGVGIIWFSWILYLFKKIPEPIFHKIPGVDVVEDLLKIAKKQQLKVLVVGGRNYNHAQCGDQVETISINKQTQVAQITHSDFQIYWTEAYEDVKRPSEFEETRINQAIEHINPDLVFVAFGAPVQEKWLAEHRKLLEKNKVKIAMAVGGSFDYLLGKVKRAPSSMRFFGFEWAYRLVKQPWRWRRQLKLVSFVQIVLQESFGKNESEPSL